MTHINDRCIAAAIRFVLQEESLRHPREPEVIGELNFLKETGFWPVSDEKLKAIYNSTRDRLHITQHIYNNPKKAKLTGDILHNYDPDKVVDIATHLNMDSDNVLIYQLKANWDVDRHDYKINSFNVRTDYDDKRYLNVVFQYDRYPTLKTAWLWDKGKEMKPDLSRYIKSKKERTEKVNKYIEYLKWKDSFKDKDDKKPDNPANNDSASVEISESQLREIVKQVSIVAINEQLRHGTLTETNDYIGDIFRGLKGLGRGVIDSSGLGGKLAELEKNNPKATEILKRLGVITPEADKAKEKAENLTNKIIKYIESQYSQPITESFTKFYNSVCAMIGAPSEANGYQFNNGSVVPSQFYNHCAQMVNQAIGFIKKWLPTHAEDFDEIEAIPDNGLYNGVDNNTRYEVANKCQQQWTEVYSAFTVLYGVLVHGYEDIKNRFGAVNTMPTKDVMKIVNQIANSANMIRNSIMRVQAFWFPTQRQQQNGNNRR